MSSYSQAVSLLLHLADNALILGHRNSEWTGHGPVLEQDIAISNIALDLVGQSRNFYQYAAEKINSENPEYKMTEDGLAYFRDAWDFKNCLLVEQTNGDWAKTILRQFLFSNHQYLLYDALMSSKDEQIAAISEKSLKETTYHLRWSSEWVIRLGDGTEESHDRMLNAIADLWKFTGEFFIATNYELAVKKNAIGIDPSALKARWQEKLESVFTEATLPIPAQDAPMLTKASGKTGAHTEALGFILSEMQFLQRAYPGGMW